MHNPQARHPAGDHRNYKARAPHQCRCGRCTAAYTTHYAEYRRRVKAEVKRGGRAAPTWMTNAAARARQQTADAAAERTARQQAAVESLEPAARAAVRAAPSRAIVSADGPRWNRKTGRAVLTVHYEIGPVQ